MAQQAHAYMPDPDKLVGFMRLQVTDALLDSDIFPDEPPADAAAALFALALLSAVPPVPANRSLLDATFSKMHGIFGEADPTDEVYNEIVHHYDRFVSVFQKAALLPKKSAMANPYEEVAKAASYQLGFAQDGVRVFHLTVWMTYYCKDALLMFYTEQAEPTAGKRIHLPEPEAAYAFISKHVNNVIADPTFFAGNAPENTTEVFTALFAFITLVLPSSDNGLLQRTFDYMRALLEKNAFPPDFFDAIVRHYELFSAVYGQHLAQGTGEPTNFTFEMLAEEAVKMLGLYPDITLKYNITSYFPMLVAEALDGLFA